MSVDRARGIQETGKKERQCRRMLKLLQNCTHLTRQQVILKILQAWRHQYVNREIPDVQTGYREGKGIILKGEPPSWLGKKEETVRTGHGTTDWF